MFSQLCRAKPSILWNKFGIRQPNTEPNESQRTNDIEFNGEDRCQLEHCTFCDFRVCCQVTPCAPQEPETVHSENPDPDTQVTENPAYGLSSKNWLESEEEEQDGGSATKAMNMESTAKNSNCDTQRDGHVTAASQDCDANTGPPEMNQVNLQSQFHQQNKMELMKTRHGTEEATKHEICCNDSSKHGKLTWSVLRHRQLGGDAPSKNCDNKSSNVIEHSTNDGSSSQQAGGQDRTTDSGLAHIRAKRNAKDRSFPLSLMRPIAKIGDKKPESSPPQHPNHASKNDLSRQRPVVHQRHAREKFQSSANTKDAGDKSKRPGNDILGMNNPLSDIAQIKSEESVQEWLARIGESVNNAWSEDPEEKPREMIPPPPPRPPRQPWSLVNNTDEEKGRDSSKHKTTHYRADLASAEASGKLSDAPMSEADTSSVLSNATKASPANVPMVVMQCSRLHSRIESKPPFQQASLPMGTLVTALYQDSEWMYVQTPHGVEGFVTASNCAPIGTVNEPAQARKPWEPCDFPIQICLRKQHELGKQQGSYIAAKLPINNGKQAPPYVSTVKMKTNFYNDRYFSHAFKSKDSIKTAKTVTDILRNSPETKVSNQ